MKRLLFPLLAALALPTAVNAGDLGSADMEDSYFIYKNKNISDFPLQDVFDKGWYCGAFTAAGNSKKCTIKFSEGKLKVDDSFGIYPSQIINVDINSIFFHGFYFHFDYLNSDGKIENAGFSASQRQIESFLIFKARFYKWLNSDK